MRGIIDKLFPKDLEQKPSSKLVERGLEALRLVRDEHAVMMGTARRVPSHFELRLSPHRHEGVAGMDALRDMEFFFKDELMKDLTAENMRTFGDHTIHVRIADDPGLNDNELYAIVLNPDRRSRSAEHKAHGVANQSHVPDDSTQVLAALPAEQEPDESVTVVLDKIEDPMPSYNFQVRPPDSSFATTELRGEHWVIGRRGSSGNPLPEGFQKLDLDLPTTVSREQVHVEIDSSSVLVTSVGKGRVTFADDHALNQNESRRIEFGASFFVEGIEMRVDRI